MTDPQSLINRRKEQMEIHLPNPNPQLVALISYAIGQVSPRLSGMLAEDYAPWLLWAARWSSGERSPQACVDVAHKCFDDTSLGHTLGQLAWGAKEACYTTSNSPWLVMRYVADAMVAFGVAFPEASVLRLSDAGDVLSIPTAPLDEGGK